ncbi:hypothetical protein [Bradyrhizobium guangzhouense]|uniref:hypothetical protein n=1 Tax=Bradyrhizobium guangzhouense TaxID=1325095 RepID=UPI0010092EE6|nr:hypothetical protein [Bradyrhizobium guangzhouense]
MELVSVGLASRSTESEFRGLERSNRAARKRTLERHSWERARLKQKQNLSRFRLPIQAKTAKILSRGGPCSFPGSRRSLEQRLRAADDLDERNTLLFKSSKIRNQPPGSLAGLATSLHRGNEDDLSAAS